MRFSGIFLVSLESFCLKDPDAAFLGLAKLSLIYLPGKGIYLSGSLVRSLKDFIIKKDFEQNYLLSNKNTPQHKILENTVINIIDQEHLALYGCLNYFNLTQKV